MGKEPEVIRQEIEETREQMGGTVDALGYKADVKSRTKDSITDKTDAVKAKLTGGTPSSGEMKQGAKRAAGVAQENPIGLAIGGLAVGFLAGMLIPSTQVEDEKLGELSDQVKERAKETGGEALERGKDVAQEAAQAAKESGKEQGEQLQVSAADKAKQTGATR